ncbi:calcium-binding protein 5 isoform X1 [Lynx rufus]|uniref:calcium-binding protein 5 isoform X1 n=2 Tax=Lynx rufus TaxID=61384 RepID=UPI001F1268DB|nr:calcium-binding protein 5 isoform X1 [Lynx rufus]
MASKAPFQHSGMDVRSGRAEGERSRFQDRREEMRSDEQEGEKQRAVGGRQEVSEGREGRGGWNEQERRRNRKGEGSLRGGRGRGWRSGCWIPDPLQIPSPCIPFQERPLGQDEIEELREAFLEFDKDRDGFISCKDLGNLMRTMGYMPTEMELTELGQQIRMNLGGRVDFDDFVELMTPKLLAETAGMIGVQEMRDAFKEFDTNGDGEITLGELQQAMQRLLGEKLTPREISEVVQEADVNGDGTVDFEGDLARGQPPRGWLSQPGLTPTSPVPVPPWLTGRLCRERTVPSGEWTGHQLGLWGQMHGVQIQGRLLPDLATQRSHA